jgi:TolA-binding protein
MRRFHLAFLIPLIACGPFFYQAPPSLGSYPERIATKRWQHIFTEVAPLNPALPTAPVLDDACKKLVESLASFDQVGRLLEISRLLAENRDGPYSSRRANFLHELWEFAADPVLLDRAKPYLDWRENHDVPLPGAPPKQRPWDLTEEQYDSICQNYETQFKERLAEFDQQIARADAPLLPYWKVRRGAFLFDAKNFPEAAKEFSSVIDSFPEHPRAEAARLMLSRCKLEQSRELRKQATIENPATNDKEIARLLGEAEVTLNEFITAHPKGRFTGDAEGWLGAIAFDQGQLGLAVRHQLARLDLQPTREVTRTVLRECDRIFEELLESQKPGESDGWLDPVAEFDAAAVAKHPAVARLFVQHAIDPAAQFSLPLYWDEDSGDRRTIDFFKRRILNPQPFVRAALSALGKEMLAAETKPDATTLTLLAWAATEEGENDQALALLDQIKAPEISDEALQARGIVLQRMDRHAEAVVAFDELSKSYPDSPLSSDLPYRRSLSLYKSGQAGRAIVEMLPLAYPSRPADDGTPSDSDAPALHPNSQIMQWLDLLVQFAPIEQLETGLLGTNNDNYRNLLQNAIRSRALAAHRFDLAEKHLTDLASGPDEQADSDYYLSQFGSGMTRIDWDQRVAPLAALYTKLANSRTATGQAEIHLAIARFWMEQRGKLTLPAMLLCDFSASEREKLDLLRRKNALELGIPRELIHQELDHRDEATHALEHALAASASQDPAIAAPTLEFANQCLFRRSEFSLYQRSRAMETDAGSLSKKIDAQLHERFPQSKETKRSVVFSYGPDGGQWMPGDYSPDNSVTAMVNTLFGKPPYSYGDDGALAKKLNDIISPIENPAPEITIAEILNQLDEAGQKLAGIRRETNPGDIDSIVQAINTLDDLKAAASLPNISAGDFHHYATGEHDSLPPAFKSLVEFPNPLADDAPAQLNAYLENYPNSPKAEAASFIMTRLIARKYRSHLQISGFPFPDAPILDGYKQVEVIRENPEINPSEVLAAIDAHEARFPKGRYRDDLNLLRAGALTDAGNFQDSLALLDSILGNPEQTDLHSIAALEFMDIAQRLLDPAQRIGVAEAMRQSPGGMKRLKLLVKGDTFLARLKPMMPWLEDGA